MQPIEDDELVALNDCGVGIANLLQAFEAVTCVVSAKAGKEGI
jgi:hypothetical protein